MSEDSEVKVKFTAEAAKQRPKYRGVVGTVVGYSRGGLLKVLWPGRATLDTLHPSFLTRLSPPPPPQDGGTT